MEQVSMNDGLDGRETIAFGLAASEVAVFVVALLTAYAVVRSGLAAALVWVLAALCLCGGAALAWGRLAGRPMLEWALLLASFLVRTRHMRAERLRRRIDRWRDSAAGVVAAARVRAGGNRSTQAGGVVIPLALRRPEPAPVPGHNAGTARGPISRARVVGFVSLAGGSGRTALAVEVAAILAVRARAAAAAGAPPRRVALIDLARRNPCVGLRLGLAPPSASAGELVSHDTGLLVGMAPPAADGSGASAPRAWDMDAESFAGDDIVILDFDCAVGEECEGILRRCDLLLVTVTPTASGVLDAYRSTALLRRLGLRERIAHVVNRWRPGVDLGEVMADLGGDVLAEVPDNPALVEAENHHRLVGITGSGDVAAALEGLAASIEQETAGVRIDPDAPRWGSNAS